MLLNTISSNIEAVRPLFVGRRKGGGGAEEGRRRSGGRAEEGRRKDGGGAEEGRRKGGGRAEEEWSVVVVCGGGRVGVRWH